MSSDLVEWLRAQLDDDERIARAAAPGPWTYQDIDSVGGGRVCDPTVAIAQIEWDNDRVDPRIRRSVFEAEADATGEHIARHHPIRELREVEAKRRRLERHRPIPADDIDWVSCSHCYVTYPCPDVADDLAAYADRPGYREEWRP